MEVKNMTKRIMNLLPNFEYREGENYEPTEYGTSELVNYCLNAKGYLDKNFSNHPNYDNDGKVVLNEKTYRNIDRNAIHRFGEWVWGNAPKIKYDFKVGDHVILYTDDNQLGGTNSTMRSLIGKEATITSCGNRTCHVDLDGEEWAWDLSYLVPVDAKESDKKIMSPEQKRFFYFDLKDFNQYLDEESVNTINTLFPWIKPHNGAKTSKVINRICRDFGLTKHEDYNREYGKFADAINPTEITRWTILSVNPIDFLMMSNGNSWKSCHWIDKTYRGVGRGYGGCYSSGTLSYAEDEVSFVLYTVDGSYKGKEYELQPKIHRQMFHYYKGILIQGRLYPNDQEGSGTQDTQETIDLYKQFREIAQRVISECFGLPNLWKNKKGTSECGKVSRSEGTHYTDYLHYSNCNVSYNKSMYGEDPAPAIRMTIGHAPICPVCGEEHDNQECILCYDCYRSGYVCARCGDCIHEDDDYIQIGDSRYCCPECAESDGYVWCANVDEWHSQYDSDVMYDDYENEWFYDRHGYWESAITTEDGSHFINEENAEYAGYRETYDGCWYHEYDVYYCEHCDRIVHRSEWDSDHDCCEDCAREHADDSERSDSATRKFKVGDLVVGNDLASKRYGITVKGWKGQVTEVYDNYFKAKELINGVPVGFAFTLKYECFDLVSEESEVA